MAALAGICSRRWWLAGTRVKDEPMCSSNLILESRLLREGWTEPGLAPNMGLQGDLMRTKLWGHLSCPSPRTACSGQWEGDSVSYGQLPAQPTRHRWLSTLPVCFRRLTTRAFVYPVFQKSKTPTTSILKYWKWEKEQQRYSFLNHPHANISKTGTCLKNKQKKTLHIWCRAWKKTKQKTSFFFFLPLHLALIGTKCGINFLNSKQCLQLRIPLMPPFPLGRAGPSFAVSSALMYISLPKA